jgi:hypothetical protein
MPEYGSGHVYSNYSPQNQYGQYSQRKLEVTALPASGDNGRLLTSLQTMGPRLPTIKAVRAG